MPNSKLSAILPRPDGVLSPNWGDFIERSLASFSVVGHSALRQACINLYSEQVMLGVTRQQLSEMTGMTESVSRYKAKALEYTLSERFLPSLQHLGLRYRCSLSPAVRSSYWPDGLVRRYNLATEYGNKPVNDEGEPYRTINIMLEPKNPERSGEGDQSSHEFLLDREQLSYRLDLYNTAEQKWEFDLDARTQKWEHHKDGWLLWKMPYERGSSRLLPPGAAELIPVLLVNEGSYAWRARLTKLLGFDPVTTSRLVKQLIEENFIRRVFHPALRYSGLPEGLIITVLGSSKSQLNKISSRVNQLFPYVHQLWNTRGDQFYFIRVPLNTAGISKSVMNEFLIESQAHYFMGIVGSDKSYFLTFKDRNSDWWGKELAKG
jgi:hypothetical protein